MVGPDGALVGHYDKLHLAQYGASMEKKYDHRGNHLFVFEVITLHHAAVETARGDALPIKKGKWWVIRDLNS